MKQALRIQSTGLRSRTIDSLAFCMMGRLRQTDALTRVLCCRSAMNWARRVVFTSDEKMNMVSSKLLETAEIYVRGTYGAQPVIYHHGFAMEHSGFEKIYLDSCAQAFHDVAV